jgi:hypothetical protein
MIFLTWLDDCRLSSAAELSTPVPFLGVHGGNVVSSSLFDCLTRRIDAWARAMAGTSWRDSIPSILSRLGAGLRMHVDGDVQSTSTRQLLAE